jgi:DNA polymerase IV (DinB-like DNA polymerase)
MPIKRAKQRLLKEDAVFIPVRKEFYTQVSERIMRLLRGYAGKFEQVSIDEAYLDVTQRVQGDFDRGKTLAAEIKAEIRRREGLTCSVGVAPNKLVAKIAASQRKPDGLVAVKPQEVKAFLAPLPVGEIPGVGKKTEKRMEEMGIRTIDDLATHRVEDVTRVFGTTVGTHFHRASHGVDETPVHAKTRVKQVSRITTLHDDTRDFTTILSDLQQLCEDVHAAVVRKNLWFKSVGVIAVVEDLKVRTRSQTLATPTNALDVLKRRSRRLLEELLQEDAAKIRRIGVKVSSFIEAVHQKNLQEFLE